MKFPGIGCVVLAFVLSSPLWLSGQVAQPLPKPPAPSSLSEDHFPDQGLLSPSRYTNRYFGFAFDLPPEAGLQPIPQRAATDSRIQLLQLVGPPPADAGISLLAFAVTSKNSPDAKSRLRHDLDQELFLGVEELHGLTKTTIAGRQFYFYETRRGIEQHLAMAVNLDNYVLVCFLGAHNEKLLRQMEASFRQIVFFPPAEAARYAGPDARDYDGPAISAHRLAQLMADPPVRHIDPGRVQGSSYENPTLGFLYRIPDGWTMEAEGAVESAFSGGDKPDDLFDPAAGRAERELAKICNKTLFSAWAKRPEADGQIPYDDFGEVTVSAAPAACFPGIKFPTDSSDRQAVKDFLLQYSLTHPIVREMRDANAFSSGGNVFIFLHGTVALKVSEDALSRRLSVGMSITQRRGYLLTWFFAAPHDTEMRDLLEQRVAFDPAPPVKEPAAAKPGGGAPSASAATSSPAPSAAPAQPAPQSEASSQPSATDKAVSSAAATSPAAPAVAAPPDSDAAADTSSKPTLLRPGETMQDQELNGKPAPKHPKK